MKTKIWTTLILSLLVNTIIGQNLTIFHFEQDTNYKKYFFIDSNDVNNIWQVGKPNKSVFTLAFSVPNAIITDTMNSYPPNNLSSFIIWHIVKEPIIVLYYYYFLNTDTLADFAKIEGSFDRGVTWINLTSPVSFFHQWDILPIFSGNTKKWDTANLEVNVELLNLYIGDTVLFKFSFESDNIDNHKDGWMIDDFWIDDFNSIGIWGDHDKEGEFQLFYRGNDEFELIDNKTFEFDNYVIQFFDLTGKLIYLFKIKNQQSNIFHLPFISHGIYLYNILSNRKVFQSGKISVLQ